MTTLAEACLRLRERNQPDPQPLIFLAHPAFTETPEGMGYLLGIRANGMDVHIAPTVDGPTFTLSEWIAYQGAPVCGNCDTRLPEGCGGLFKDEAPCRWEAPEQATVESIWKGRLP